MNFFRDLMSSTFTTLAREKLLHLTSRPQLFSCAAVDNRRVEFVRLMSKSHNFNLGPAEACRRVLKSMVYVIITA